ncbi:DgyrCDS12583 [Dimorphilus gyrociliatus]|uniref:DgyrCDS12583 n=1 Tax=Dimorphilus gyrociliatus TaxID=2664684 RepID=A0A7I8W6Y2_9ANNE|nr:DgyrCDS12583 [Dimorphilus gyrociliatus]
MNNKEGLVCMGCNERFVRLHIMDCSHIFCDRCKDNVLMDRCCICLKRAVHSRVATRLMKNDRMVINFSAADKKPENKKIRPILNEIKIRSEKKLDKLFSPNVIMKDRRYRKELKIKPCTLIKDIKSLKEQSKMKYSQKEVALENEEMEMDNTAETSWENLLIEKNRQIKSLRDELIYLKSENKQYRELMARAFSKLSAEGAEVVKEKLKLKLDLKLKRSELSTSSLKSIDDKHGFFGLTKRDFNDASSGDKLEKAFSASEEMDYKPKKAKEMRKTLNFQTIGK